MVIGLLMVTPPKPPGSSASISPPTAVLEYAPGNVLHGAVRLHGLASSPTPETHVRVACACAAEVIAQTHAASAKKTKNIRLRFMPLSSEVGVSRGRCRSVRGCPALPGSVPALVPGSDTWAQKGEGPHRSVQTFHGIDARTSY